MKILYDACAGVSVAAFVLTAMASAAALCLGKVGSFVFYAAASLVYGMLAESFKSASKKFQSKELNVDFDKLKEKESKDEDT